MKVDYMQAKSFGNVKTGKVYLQESTTSIADLTTTTIFTMTNGQTGIISAEGDNSMYAAAFFQYNSTYSGYNFSSLGKAANITVWGTSGANIWLRHNKGYTADFKIRVTIF